MASDGVMQVGVVPVGQEGLARREYMHTLSLRLTADQYRRLRRFVTAVEEQTEQRITHQSVLETALAEFIERQRERSTLS